MTQAYLDHVAAILTEIENEGMMKRERAITTPQSGEICNKSLLRSWGRTMRFYLLRVSTPTAACSNRCWARKTRSYQTA